MTTTGLADQLRSAAVDVINERGVHGFSLREVARRAGVSHAAPAYHFTNAAGLLTSLAIDGFAAIHRAFEAATAAHDDPVERLAALGRAYVRTCREYPAQTALAFQPEVSDHSDPALLAAGGAVHRLLSGAVAAVAAEHNPDLDVATGTDLAWASMQGLLTLHPIISLGTRLSGLPEPPIEDIADRFNALLIAGLAPKAGS
jgi:AcrR family transcriptional regulator